MSDMDVTASVDGSSIIISISNSPVSAGALSIPTNEIGELITRLRAAATDCRETVEVGAGTSPPDASPTEDTRGDGISISDVIDSTGLAVLTLSMDGIQLSVGIPNECLSQVGLTFLTLSADRSMPQ